jgi:hypothetical protein
MTKYEASSDTEVAAAERFARSQVGLHDGTGMGAAIDYILSLVERVKTDSGTMARQAEMVKDALREASHLKKENSFLRSEMMPTYFAAEAGSRLQMGKATEKDREDIEAWFERREGARNLLWTLFSASPILLQVGEKGDVEEVQQTGYTGVLSRRNTLW